MKKIIGLFSVLLIFTCVAAHVSYAQLVNYDRLRRRIKLKGGAPLGEVKTDEEQEDAVIPKWVETWPWVTTRLERKYDINRDGKLQTAEVKIYLRDTVATIEKKGGIIINSDILLEYDINEDGVVSLKEIARLKKDAGL